MDSNYRRKNLLARQKIEKRIAERRQILLLVCVLLVALIILALVPTGSSFETPSRELNELEMRQEMSRAADDYLLGRTREDRQAAAREVHGIRDGRSYNPESTAELVGLLRIVLFITIVFAAWRIIALLTEQFKPIKPQQA